MERRPEAARTSHLVCAASTQTPRGLAEQTSESLDQPGCDVRLLAGQRPGRRGDWGKGCMTPRATGYSGFRFFLQ